MSAPRTVPEALAELPAACPDARVWLVAYSGGMDSTVLLHAAHALGRTCGRTVRAVHVHHGLQPAADDFERHCVQVCAAWGVPLECVRRTVAVESGQSLEAQARRVRYQALREQAPSGSAVLLGHHLDDQAETVLLQLLRGAGVAGTAGMPWRRDWGGSQLVRPLLEVARTQIECYMREHGLPYLEDPSNRDERLERNYLRRTAWPVLQARWPGLSQTLARAARHHAHATRLLREFAEEDAGEAAALPVARLEGLSEDRQLNALRYWIMRQGFLPPGERRLRNWRRMALEAGEDRVPSDRCEAYALYRWRGRLHLVPRRPEVLAGNRWPWRQGASLPIPELGLTLEWEALQAQLEERIETDVEVRLRTGGERCRPCGRQHRHRLKKLLQEAGVPPWRRGRIPLIYQHAQLRLVWGHFACAPPSR